MRMARATLSEVTYSAELMAQLQELLLDCQDIFGAPHGDISPQHASVELMHTQTRRAIGVIRFNPDAGLTFTPAAEQVIM